ncbi:MAG: hypothetical protein QF464_10235, partial [Myxococcota bacterium]|nr:hypothetical protein [Myxococcota bacterium]
MTIRNHQAAALCVALTVLATGCESATEALDPVNIPGDAEVTDVDSPEGDTGVTAGVIDAAVAADADAPEDAAGPADADAPEGTADPGDATPRLSDAAGGPLDSSSPVPDGESAPDSLAPEPDIEEPPAPQVTPVYFTVAGHIEPGLKYADCAEYPLYRAQLITFVETLTATGARFNLQASYTFFQGAANCEDEAMKASTAGLNVLDYLITQHGVEVDAHEEGGTENEAHNYADTHFMGLQATQGMSPVVGGLKWDDPAMFDILAAGQDGWLHPEYTWHPSVLSLGVGTQHHFGDFDD